MEQKTDEPVEVTTPPEETPEQLPKSDGKKFKFTKKTLLITGIAACLLLVLTAVGTAYYSTLQFGVTPTPTPTTAVTPTLEPTPTTASTQPKKMVPTSTITLSPTVKPTGVISNNNPSPTNTPVPNTPTTIPPQSYSISGVVFKDDNGNGVRDGGEAGIADRNVIFLSVNKSTTTDSSGNYTMSGLTPGNYNITVNRPEGLNGTTDNPAHITITVGNANKDFGFN